MSSPSAAGTKQKKTAPAAPSASKAVKHIDPSSSTVPLPASNSKDLPVTTNKPSHQKDLTTSQSSTAKTIMQNERKNDSSKKATEAAGANTNSDQQPPSSSALLSKKLSTKSPVRPTTAAAAPKAAVTRSKSPAAPVCASAGLSTSGPKALRPAMGNCGADGGTAAAVGGAPPALLSTKTPEESTKLSSPAPLPPAARGNTKTQSNPTNNSRNSAVSPEPAAGSKKSTNQQPSTAAGSVAASPVPSHPSGRPVSASLSPLPSNQTASSAVGAPGYSLDFSAPSVRTSATEPAFSNMMMLMETQQRRNNNAHRTLGEGTGEQLPPQQSDVEPLPAMISIQSSLRQRRLPLGEHPSHNSQATTAYSVTLPLSQSAPLSPTHRQSSPNHQLQYLSPSIRRWASGQTPATSLSPDGTTGMAGEHTTLLRTFSSAAETTAASVRAASISSPDRKKSFQKRHQETVGGHRHGEPDYDADQQRRDAVHQQVLLNPVTTSILPLIRPSFRKHLFWWKVVLLVVATICVGSVLLYDLNLSNLFHTIVAFGGLPRSIVGGGMATRQQPFVFSKNWYTYTTTPHVAPSVTSHWQLNSNVFSNYFSNHIAPQLPTTQQLPLRCTGLVPSSVASSTSTGGGKNPILEPLLWCLVNATHVLPLHTATGTPLWPAALPLFGNVQPAILFPSTLMRSRGLSFLSSAASSTAGTATEHRQHHFVCVALASGAVALTSCAVNVPDVVGSSSASNTSSSSSSLNLNADGIGCMQNLASVVELTSTLRNPLRCNLELYGVAQSTQQQVESMIDIAVSVSNQSHVQVFHVKWPLVSTSSSVSVPTVTPLPLVSSASSVLYANQTLQTTGAIHAISNFHRAHHTQTGETVLYFMTVVNVPTTTTATTSSSPNNLWSRYMVALCSISVASFAISVRGVYPSVLLPSPTDRHFTSSILFLVQLSLAENHLVSVIGGSVYVLPLMFQPTVQHNASLWPTVETAGVTSLLPSDSSNQSPRSSTTTMISSSLNSGLGSSNIDDGASWLFFLEKPWLLSQQLGLHYGQPGCLENQYATDDETISDIALLSKSQGFSSNSTASSSSAATSDAVMSAVVLTSSACHGRRMLRLDITRVFPQGQGSGDDGGFYVGEHYVPGTYSPTAYLSSASSSSHQQQTGGTQPRTSRLECSVVTLSPVEVPYAGDKPPATAQLAIQTETSLVVVIARASVVSFVRGDQRWRLIGRVIQIGNSEPHQRSVPANAEGLQLRVELLSDSREGGSGDDDQPHNGLNIQSFYDRQEFLGAITNGETP